VTTTRPDGRTATRQFPQTNNGNGSFTDTRTLMSANGATRTTSITRTPGFAAPAGYWSPGRCCVGAGLAAAGLVGLTIGLGAVPYPA
jgi:hypothetical protein